MDSSRIGGKYRILLFCMIHIFLLSSQAFDPRSVAAQADSPAPAVDARQDLLDRINQERAEQGLAPLTENKRLSDAALLHSLDMANNDFFAHEGSDDSTADQRVERQGYPWMMVSENLSCGSNDVDYVTRKWMESPEHRKNILDPQAEHIGIGMVADPESKCSPYWTTNFAAKK